MVKVWKSEKSADETCPSCGITYEVTESRLPARESDSFNCTQCGELVKKWKGTSSFSYEIKSSG